MMNFSNIKTQTRRKFLFNSSKLLAALFGSVAFGKSFLFSQTPDALPGNQTKNENKILVVYESQFGSTKEVASYITKILAENGSIAEVKKIDEIENLSTYKNVVIGSPIQYDTWMPGAREFVETNKKVLAKIPVAFFFTCLVLSKQSDDAEEQAKGYSEKLYNLVPMVKPVSVGGFAGVLDYSKMSFVFRLIAKAMFAILGVKEGDYRNWKAIRSWTNKTNF